MIELKVVQGRSDLLLLFDGKAGIPETRVDEGARDLNEVCRFVLGDRQLAGRVPYVAGLGALLGRCAGLLDGGFEGTDGEYEAACDALLEEIGEVLR